MEPLPQAVVERERYFDFTVRHFHEKLGERVHTEFGSKYDIRAFHDKILKAGALPFDVFDARITARIVAKKWGAPLQNTGVNRFDFDPKTLGFAQNDFLSDHSLCCGESTMFPRL